MPSVSVVHAIGMLSTLTIFMIISVASVIYVSSMTQVVVKSQLEEVAARVSTTIVDLTVLAANSKSESLVIEKRVNVPASLNDNAYSVLLMESDGMWKVVARLDSQPTVSGEAVLWDESSQTLKVIPTVVPTGKPLIVRCEKTIVDGNLSITVQILMGG